MQEQHHRSVWAAAILLAALAPSCQQPVESLPAPIRPVIYREVYSTGGVRTRTFSGSAKAGVESNISFKVSGTLERLPIKVGDLVRQGQLIARLDATDYELRVEDVAAALAQARALAVKARADLERIRGLYERDNASQADYDAARAAADSAEANVRSMEKKLETARLQVKYCTLNSPIDGAVAEVPVEVNENVQQGQTIVTLTSGIRPEVEVAIPELLIGEIREGQAATVTFDAFPQQRFAGRVTEVAPAAGRGLTTYPVTVRLNRSGNDILPGMAAEVAFQFGTANGRPRYVVPPHAVGEDRQGRFVYVVNSESDGLATVERRPVAVGELVSDGLEVFEGLQDGDRVVTSGVARITDGQQVKLDQPAG